MTIGNEDALPWANEGVEVPPLAVRVALGT